MQLTQSYEIGSVDRREVLRYLGYDGQQMDEGLERRIDETCARAIALARPRGCVRVFEVDQMREREGVPELELAGTALVLSGTSICEHLAGAHAVGVLAVTLGMATEQELRRLSLTDALGQAVFDSACAALVERAADAAEASLREQARDRGLYTKWRFSPGYGDLSLSTQRQLLDAVDAPRRLGIRLSDSLLMMPTKSVTALVGMFAEPQGAGKVSCRDCACYDFCNIRRTGRTCRD